MSKKPIEIMHRTTEKVSANTMVGCVAPDFTLPNENGEPVSLSGLLAVSPVMLVFYPGDFTLVCTKQLCGYQGKQDKFQELGIRIIGISHNSGDSHKKFREQYGLSFSLLSDLKREIFRTYGVTSLFMLGGTSRAVFLISRKGRVLYRHVEPTILTHRKAPEMLQAIGALKIKGEL